MVYYFNFGQNHNQKCKGQQVGVSEVLEVLKQVTDTCEVLGRTEYKEFGLIDKNDPKKGITVTYGGGDRCTNGDNPAENGKPRKSKFILVCAGTQDPNFKINFPGETQGTTKCTLEFKINTPAGCPGGGIGYKSSTILLFILGGLFVYFGLGTFYNMKTQNLEGKEALPNVEFWRSFPDFVKEGLSKSVQSANAGVGWVKSKVSGESSNYNEF